MFPSLGYWMPIKDGDRIGAALLEAVPKPRQLKCTVDNQRANDFYAQSMTHHGTEPGRVRALNVWRAAQ